jgi:hypothetical protein
MIGGDCMNIKLEQITFSISIIVILMYIGTSASYASIDPWSHFTYSIGYYNEDYALDTDQTDYNDIHLSVFNMISVGGKNSGYSPFLIPAEYYMYEENGQGLYEKVFLMPILKGGRFELISEDVFSTDETGRQPWGKEMVSHYYFIDKDQFKIGYKASVQPYIGITKVEQLQELPWPHYFESNRRVLLYPVTEEEGLALAKQYDNDAYRVPNFYCDTDMYSEDYYELLAPIPVIETADTWAKEGLQAAIDEGLATDRMTKMYYKMPTRRDEFSELVMRFYDLLKGPEILVSDNPFTDTDSMFVLRANKAGIVNGMGEGIFNPEGEINKETLCVMIVRALKSAGIEVNEAGDFKQKFGDVNQVSSWALSSMKILNQAEIYKGDGINLMPKQIVDKETALILLYRAYNHYK